MYLWSTILLLWVYLMDTQKQKNICIRLFIISLITYTTSNLNAYQQELAQLNNGSYKQWTMFSLDIKTVTSPVCKSLCSYYLLTLILELQCLNNMNFISCSCYSPVRGRGGGHGDVFFAVFQTSGWYRLCHL